MEDGELGFDKLSSKKQIRIPKKVIEHLSLKTDDLVLFYKKSSDIIMVKGKAVPDKGGK